MKRLMILLALFCGFYSIDASAKFTKKYDKWFERYSEMYQPTKDWRLLKSQCIAESNLIYNAVSPAGALGTCQFMPATWKETEHILKLNGNPFNPELNIQFAAFYMLRQERFWTAPRPIADRTSLAMASYNAGAGNLLKAQKKCGGPNLYKDIIVCLPQITGHHSKETITYVERIWRFYIMTIYGLI